MTLPAAAHFDEVDRRFRDATPGSRALYEQALMLMPAGISRGSQPIMAYPIFADHAQDQHLVDVDGNVLVDMWNAASSLPLGHRHPAVVGAVEAQLAKGLGFGVMAAVEVEFARLLRERIPSMEMTRLTLTGSEATMFAARLACAFTGRSKIGRMEGSYHGMHDLMCSGQGVALGGLWPGTEDDPVSNGVPKDVRNHVVFMPFNDLESCERVIEDNAAELATVIVEPFVGSGGGLEAAPGFLQGLRDLCDRHDILLTFDEMISIGIDRGGAQGFYGVTPDLTTAGKSIGGGMPFGVFGGRADIMEMLVPVDGVPPVLHTGTWNGHAACVAAGIAQLNALDDQAYATLHRRGEQLREGVRCLATEMGIALQVTGVAQHSAFHFNDAPVLTHADTKRDDAALAKRVAFALLTRGFYIFGSRTNLSTAITEDDVERFLAALGPAIVEASRI